MTADQVLQQLRLNGNASSKCCNSIGDQSAIVVKDESGSTSTRITTIADKSTFNGNVRCGLSATEKCLQDHSHKITFIGYVMMSQTQSLSDERFMDVARVYPATFPRSSVMFCEKKH